VGRHSGESASIAPARGPVDGEALLQDRREERSAAQHREANARGGADNLGGLDVDQRLECQADRIEA
jgi:hypothetical protein